MVLVTTFTNEFASVGIIQIVKVYTKTYMGKEGYEKNFLTKGHKR